MILNLVGQSFLFKNRSFMTLLVGVGLCLSLKPMAKAESIGPSGQSEKLETSTFCDVEGNRKQNLKQDLVKMRGALVKHQSCKEMVSAIAQQDLALKYFEKFRKALCETKGADSKEIKRNLEMKFDHPGSEESGGSTDNCDSFDLAKETENQGAEAAIFHKQRLRDGFKSLWKEIHSASEATSDAIDLSEEKRCGNEFKNKAQASKKNAASAFESGKVGSGSKAGTLPQMKSNSGSKQPKKDGPMKEDFNKLFSGKESYFGKLLVMVKNEEKNSGVSKEKMNRMSEEMKLAREKCKSTFAKDKREPAGKASVKSNGQRNCYFEYASTYTLGLDQMKKIKSEHGSCALVGADMAGGPNMQFLRNAKKAGLDSHVYLEGPGGPTGNAWDPAEKERARQHAKEVGITGPNWMKEWDKRGWIEYARKQIKEYDDMNLGVKSYEIDNIERVIGKSPEKTVAFLADQQKWMEENNIKSKFLLKNMVSGRMEAIEKAIENNTLKRETFSDFAIIEVSKKAINEEDDNGFPMAWGKKSADSSARVGIQTVFAYNTYAYQAKGKYQAK